MHHFNALKALELTCIHDHPSISQLHVFLSKQIWSPKDRQIILNTVAEILCAGEEELTQQVATYFSPILLDLLYRIKKKGWGEELFIVLSDLIGHFTDATQFAYSYFDAETFHFTDDKSEKHHKRFKSNEHSDKTLIKVLAAFKFLNSNPKWFAKAWDWSFISDLLQNPDSEIKWIALHCFSILSSMTEYELNEKINNYFTKDDEVRLRFKYFNMLKSRVPLFIEIENNVNIDVDCNQQYTRQHFLDCDFVSECRSLCGVLLSCVKVNSAKSDLILVDSTKRVLRLIVLSVSCGNSVILQGPIGCGKSSLINYVASFVGRTTIPEIVKLQMGEQIDGKLLIGAHCCTDIPGEFVWKPGPLTNAFIKGHWLVLEDIDSAPPDVISTLASILESKSLSSLPGCGSLNQAMHSSFRIFFTRRLLSSHSNDTKFSDFLVDSSVQNLIDKLCDIITFEEYKRSELTTIIALKWPIFSQIIDRLLDIYYQLKEDYSSATNRQISLHDLMKWCQRVAKYFQINSDEVAVNAFLDATDCFIESQHSKDDKISKSEQIGVKLNLTKVNSIYLYSQRKPELTIRDNFVKVGRVTIAKKTKILSLPNTDQRFFAFTQQSLTLLEKVSCSIVNNEPILLCGETGTGKTSSVQYLANLLGHKLIVVNMNQQSDTCDLLGGYKPVDLKYLLTPIKTEFETLFSISFEISENTKFLTHLSREFHNENWLLLFKLMLHVQSSAMKKVKTLDHVSKWKLLGERIRHLERKCKLNEKGCLGFSYIEGSLVKAMREGHWILLDEINLAESETLQCLSGVLDSSSDYPILLLDKADGMAVTRHPEFRLFACMNPATDIGKKELPLGIRNRFTEFYVEELEDKYDLQILIDTYLKGVGISKSLIDKIVHLYLKLKKEAKESLKATSGSGPHYSMRFAYLNTF